MNSCLVDVNVWVALSLSTHIHHRVASSWLSEFEGAAYFCRTTHLGLLRLLTNHHVMGIDVRTHREAWEVYDALLADSRVGFIEESGGTEEILRDLTRGKLAATKTWTDAYLAAFALSADLEIISLDAGFSKVAGLRAIVLGG